MKAGLFERPQGGIEHQEPSPRCFAQHSKRSNDWHAVKLPRLTTEGVTHN